MRPANPFKNYKHKSFIHLSLLFFPLFHAVCAADLSEYERCVLQKSLNAGANVLVTDVSEQCKALNNAPALYDEPFYNKPLTEQPSNGSLVEARLKIDQSNVYKPFTLMAHKPNYIIPLAYNRSGYNASFHQQQSGDPDISFEDYEAQFQISIKTPLALNLFNKDIQLYTGYTNRSFWQVYNSKISRPFRETNHEPELWFQTTRSTNVLGFDNRINMLGVSHQSNGRGDELSRSWNRIYAQFAFEKESFVFAIKLWSRFNESTASDDNPDITDFMGHGEFRAIYKHDHHTLSLMSRNNFESGFDRGATELGWSFQLGEREDLKGYIQIFSGYGESLIDYDQSVNRIGIGIALSDWL